MPMMVSHLRKCLAVTCLYSSAVSLSATGFRLPDQDAFATARGEAFAATADNPSAIYYNPAGITQLPDQNARVGLYGIYLKSEYTGAAGKFETKSNPQVVPQVYFTSQFKD